MANGLQSILELTLHIPISYENRTLSKSIMVDEVNTFEVIVSSLFEGERVLIVNFLFSQSGIGNFDWGKF